MKQLLTLLFALLALSSCLSNTENISVGEAKNPSATKIINRATSAISGQLILYLSEEAVASFESCRGTGITRSTIEPLNISLGNIGATKIERLFPLDPRHEEDARAFNLHRWYIVEFSRDIEVENAAKQLCGVEDVEYIQYNTRYQNPDIKSSTLTEVGATRATSSTFNDDYFSRQWDMQNNGNQTYGAVAGMDINVVDAWRYCTGHKDIIVAVIDEGVDYTHEDLKDNMWVNTAEIAGNGIDDDGNGYVDDIHGYNFVTEGDISWNRQGDSGHGTHVAGTVAAVNNNGKGICGVAGGDGSGNGIKILSAQIFSGKQEGSGGIAATAKAFNYAANNGAHIAQCSYGIDPSIKGVAKNDSEYSKVYGSEYSAMQYFVGKSRTNSVINGGIIIFAAGNEYYHEAAYPGALCNNISVTSLGPSGFPAYYTNYGPGCNIAAPGGDQSRSSSGGILSTYPGDGYAYMQGTSMACPHVSGVAALGLSYAKQLGKTFTVDEFKAMLLLSVNDINSYIATNEDYNKYFQKVGTGRVDAFKMLMHIEGVTCISVPRGKANYGIDLTPYLLDGALVYKPMEIKVPTDVATRLGIESQPRFFGNKFLITCNNIGSGVVEVSFVAGTTVPGGDEQKGGMVATKRFALIVRDDFAENGGWM